MPLPELDGNTTWCAICDAYGEHFAIEIAPSKNHPGYYHIATICFADNFADETKKPIRADAVELHVSYFLKQHGLVIDDMRWFKNTHEKPALATQENE